MNNTSQNNNEIVLINIPDSANEDAALRYILDHVGFNKVKIIGKLKEWYVDLNDWISSNEIIYIDLYDLTEMFEWGDPIEYREGPSGGIYNCDFLEEVVLPKNLKELGIMYFEGCSSLHTIHIPAALENIQNSPESPAFPDSNLKKIFLELSNNNWWVIPDYSYAEIEYTIADDNFKEIDGVLYDLDKKTLMKISGDFKKEFLFPSCIDSIMNNAFRNAQINKLFIPKNIRNFGFGIFRGAVIDTIIFEEGIEYISNNCIFSDSHIKNIILPSTLKEIGFQLFTGGDSYENVSFKNYNPVFEIENYVVYNKQFKSVVAYIPYQLNEYVVREGTTNIGKTAFSQGYFKNNDKKISITLPNSIERIEEEAFSHCNFEEIHISDSLKYIGKDAFAWSNIKSIIIPDSIEFIEEGAFCGCSSLVEIKLPVSIKKIEDLTFHYCTSLESIDLPDNVVEIGSQCFDGCVNLKKVHLPEKLTNILEMAFSDCKSLQSIIFPETLEKIDDLVFYNCSSLEEIRLPDSINYLGSMAFGNCVNLKRINIPTDCELFDVDSDFQFDECNSLYDVAVAEDNPYYTFSDGILYNKQGDYLIKSFSDNKVIEILDRVRSIGQNAFANTPCRVLFMPDNVEKIGVMAFYNCRDLEHIRFSRNIKAIDIEHFWKEDTLTGEQEGPFGSLFDKCDKLSRITNVSIETLQKFPDVFKGISIVNETSEQESVKKKVKILLDEPIIPNDVLDTIDSNYFVDPQNMQNKIRTILKYRDDAPVKREASYLNDTRILLENFKTSLQDVGIIPLRCWAFNTGMKILENSWPNEIVPENIRQNIMKVVNISNCGSHTYNQYLPGFNNYGYTNNDIIEFCLNLIRYIKYIKDFSLTNGFDRKYFESFYGKYIYRNHASNETSNSTIGFIQSYTRRNYNTNKEERIIELIHKDKSWAKITVYKDILVEYYKKTGFIVEEDQEVKVKFDEKRNRKNNLYWIASEILEIIRKEPLFDTSVIPTI